MNLHKNSIYKFKQNNYILYILSQTIISRNLCECVCVCVCVCGKFPSAYIKRTVRVTGLVFFSIVLTKL